MLRIAKLSSLIFGALLLVSFARAEHHNKMGDVHVHGHLDVFYTNNSNANNGLQYSYNADDDDFGLGAAQIAFSGSAKHVDWYIDLAYGNTQRTTDATSTAVNQAFLTSHINDQLSFTVGRMFSNVGFEGNYSKDNWNYSRSLAFSNAAPIYHEGVALKYNHNSGFGAGLFYYDGGDETNDTDTTHATSLQLSYGMNNWAVVYNYYTDKDNETAAGTGNGFGGNTVIHNINGTFDVNDRFSLALSYIMGEVDENGTQPEWSSIALYGKYMLNKKWSLAARVEMWKEENGTILGSNVAGGTNNEEDITSLTLTAAHYCESGSEMRLEVRQDTADDQIWRNDDNTSAEDGQTTVTAAWIHAF